MSTQHKNIPEADLHEMKGAAAAAVGKVPIASGTGTTPFGYANPIGACHFVDYAAPYVLTYPAAYTKAVPVTVANGVPLEVTEGVNARLTYTGTLTTKFRIVCNVSLAQASGANRDIGLKIYKNGVAVNQSEIFTSTSTAYIQLITSVVDLSLATNDYIECFAINKGASGDISFYSFYLTMNGVRG